MCEFARLGSGKLPSTSAVKEAGMKTIDVLQGDKWLGHPVHPALVSVPIGAWVFSLVMDGVATVSKSQCAQEAADFAITAGLVGAGLSASAGVSEFLRVPDSGDAVDDAVTHGALNVGATALYAVNALIRSSRRGRGKPVGAFPKLLSLIGVAAIGYTGWLGGNLVYSHGTAVHIDKVLDEQGHKEEPRERGGAGTGRRTPARAHM
jgi:uncharacterized membrane protein